MVDFERFLGHISRLLSEEEFKWDDFPLEIIQLSMFHDMFVASIPIQRGNEHNQGEVEEYY